MIEFSLREETRIKARQIAEPMSREDGVGTAIRQIERAIE